MLLIGAWNKQHWMMYNCISLHVYFPSAMYLTLLLESSSSPSSFSFHPSVHLSAGGSIQEVSGWSIDFLFSQLREWAMDYEIINFKLKKLNNQSMLLIFINKSSP